MTIRKLILASDPEMFVKKGGHITSVAGLLGCSKSDKLDFEDTRIQEDNVLIEFDINPHDNFMGFNQNLMRGVQLCNDLVNALDMEIAPSTSSHVFTAEQIASFHKRALEFGCEPDFNALTGLRNPKPKAADPGLRTAGGHVHFGFDHLGTWNTENQKILGVMCDYFLALPSMLIDPDDRRRELYGKAGACRWKPYGIEYRTLSNFWIFDEANRRFVFDQANKAYNSTVDRDYHRMVSIVDPNTIQEIINTNNKHQAEFFLKKLGVA